jgi:hypothetical protein
MDAVARRQQEALGNWRGGMSKNISAASRGERRSEGSNLLTNVAKNLGSAFKIKNNWSNKYLYRGLRINSPNNIRTIQGYSSWSANIGVARKFAGGQSPVILRINTNTLKRVPVIHDAGGYESEYILPPMKMILNNTYNGNFLPVRNIVVNQRWASQNAPSIIPRMAARRFQVSPSPSP